MVVRFEDMCIAPGDVMHRVQRHVELPGDALPILAEQRIRAPDYYRPPFEADDERLIRACTAETAARFGYGTASASCRSEREKVSKWETGRASCRERGWQ